MRVVLDTNVLISALLWHGQAHKLMSLIEKGVIIPCFSEETIKELRGVLSRPKFKDKLDWLNLGISDIIIPLLSKSEIFKLPKIDFCIVRDDPDDDKFLYLAFVAKAKYVVSGDKHLLKLGRFANIEIITISKFLSLT